MKRFKKQEIDPKDYKEMETAANIVRVVLFPIYVLIRFFIWLFKINV